MLPHLLAVAAGLVLLTGGAAALVRGAAALAIRLGLSPLIVGLTVVAFGTSAPELVVSVDAALRGAGGIAVGNVVGSNVANVGLILAAAALVRPFVTDRALVRRDLPLMLASTALLIGMLLDHRVSTLEGGVLAAGLVGYLALGVRQARHDRRAAAALEAEVPRPDGPAWRDPVLVVVGIAGLIAGAELLVGGAVALAALLGVSETLVGLTVVALGTSLPELATSVTAAARGHGALAAGGVVGSNLFNVLGILGVAALVRPLAAPAIGNVDLAVMAALAVAAFLLMWTGRRLTRVEGAFLLAGYAGYMGFLAFQHA